jgi:hypothetical protein
MNDREAPIQPTEWTQTHARPSMMWRNIVYGDVLGIRFAVNVFIASILV